MMRSRDADVPQLLRFKLIGLPINDNFAILESPRRLSLVISVTLIRLVVVIFL